MATGLDHDAYVNARKYAREVFWLFVGLSLLLAAAGTLLGGMAELGPRSDPQDWWVSGVEIQERTGSVATIVGILGLTVAVVNSGAVSPKDAEHVDGVEFARIEFVNLVSALVVMGASAAIVMTAIAQVTRGLRGPGLSLGMLANSEVLIAGVMVCALAGLTATVAVSASRLSALRESARVHLLTQWWDGLHSARSPAEGESRAVVPDMSTSDDAKKQVAALRASRPSLRRLVVKHLLAAGTAVAVPAGLALWREWIPADSIPLWFSMIGLLFALVAMVGSLSGLPAARGIRLATRVDHTMVSIIGGAAGLSGVAAVLLWDPSTPSENWFRYVLLASIGFLVSTTAFCAIRSRSRLSLPSPGSSSVGWWMSRSATEIAQALSISLERLEDAERERARKESLTPDDCSTVEPSYGQPGLIACLLRLVRSQSPDASSAPWRRRPFELRQR